MANAVPLGGPLTPAALAQALGGPVQPVVATGAMQNRGVMPQNLEDLEKFNRTWHQVVNGALGNSGAADPNMQMSAPPANDAMEISKGKYSGLGQITSYGNDPTDVVAQRQMPTIGPMQGQAVLSPTISAQFQNAQARPLGSGEYVKNPDGSWSNEITTTTDPGAVPQLNGGRPTVVPTLWIIKGQPTRVDGDTAARLAAQSGLQFPSFSTPQEAEAFANSRESNWQNVKPEQSGTVAPLWSAPSAEGSQ